MRSPETEEPDEEIEVFFNRAWNTWPVAFLLLSSAGEIPARAQTDAVDASRALAELRLELETLKADHARRIAALEEKIAEIEGTVQPPASPASGKDAPDDELASLRAAAREAAGETRTSAVPPPAVTSPPAAAAGLEGSLNRLNPEVSFTGILLGATLGDERDEFAFEEFELDLQSALDPFSRTRVTLAVGDEGLEIEEAYVNYSSLPGGLNLLAGKFRQRFGPLNRQHLHALPQTTYPLVYQTVFGDEGLGQTGLSFSWLLPKPWATANEVTIEVTDGENETAFAGEEFEDLAVLARLANFWELSGSGYFEWGLSGIAGKTGAGGASRVYGTDFTYDWQPAGRSKYRGLTWRTEILWSEREDALGVRHDAVGGYTYAEGLLRRNLFGGVRFDRAENPLDPGSHTTGFVPYVSWWQSEYVRLRAEYALYRLEPSGASDDRLTLQLTWAAGPHKHESY